MKGNIQETDILLWLHIICHNFDRTESVQTHSPHTHTREQTK
jgi:hypothetical protein